MCEDELLLTRAVISNGVSSRKRCALARKPGPEDLQLKPDASSGLVMMSRLDRFKSAQAATASGFATALAEIRAGAKRSHWIWYIFPQIAGLGRSPTAQTFAIEDEDEAVMYLQDPELRGRLLTILTAAADSLRTGRADSLGTLMGSDIDAQKLVSSLTLFRHVAKTLHQRDGLDDYASIARVADELLAIAASEGYPTCAFTLARVRSAR